MVDKTAKRINKRSKNKTCKNEPYQTYKPFEKQLGLDFKNNKLNEELIIPQLKNQLLKDLKKAVNLHNVKPSDNFYDYINQRWLDNSFDNNNYKYLVQYDNFRVVQENVYGELLKILDDFLKNETDKSKFKQSMINFIGSLDLSNDERKTDRIVGDYITKIQDLQKNTNNLWKLMAMLNENEIVSWGAPFVWKVIPDDKNADFFKTYIGCPKLTLNNINLYFEVTTASDKNYLKEYNKYISDLFENSLGTNHPYDCKNVYLCEQKIVNALGCLDDKIKTVGTYNVVSTNDSLNKYGFNWPEIAKQLGYKKMPKSFVTPSLLYLKCMSKTLSDEWTSKEWETYFVYIYIRQVERWTKNGRKITHKFQTEFVRGGQYDIPDDVLNILPIGYAFPTFLNNEYIKKFNNVDNIIYAKGLSEDLTEVFKRMVNSSNWLQKQTKLKALEKLDKFKINVGSDLQKELYPVFDFKDVHPWENITLVSNWRTKMFIELDGKPRCEIPIIDWSVFPPKFLGNQSFIVNAMYTPNKNAIDVPLGYLQKPFVDLDDRGIEYNLAHIGFTLSHEMSHSLDDWGSQYNAYGKLENWWTPQDREHFKKLQVDVIKQYETFAKYDGIDFDAKLSIGEDLADISGLAICTNYLSDFQMKNKDILPIKELSFKVFFVYYAFQQRQKLNKKVIKAQLLTNPHPLDKYRTNVPLSRNKVFRSIYAVKKGDKMWWPSTNKTWEN